MTRQVQKEARDLGRYPYLQTRERTSGHSQRMVVVQLAIQLQLMRFFLHQMELIIPMLIPLTCKERMQHLEVLPRRVSPSCYQSLQGQYLNRLVMHLVSHLVAILLAATVLTLMVLQAQQTQMVTLLTTQLMVITLVNM